MSSTNRGADRHVADYYITPQWAIRDFFNAASRDEETEGIFRGPDSDMGNMAILDPCAGGDAKNPTMAYPKAITDSGHFVLNHKLTTVDWREDSSAEIKSDFLMWQPGTQFDLAITNPPFGLAQDVINRCFQIVRGGGYIVMLLRLNFFGGEKRRDWWQKAMPINVYVHSKRIGFQSHMQIDSPDFLVWYEKNKSKYPEITRGLSAFRSQTDSIEYVHAVWRVGENPSHTKLKVI